MSVRRIVEQPRVTKPYSEAEWQEILAAGHAIDERLQAGDVRLTVGGEPTFVSIDDRDEPEWNTAAVGRQTRPRRRPDPPPAGAVRARRPAAGHQGKWYPASQLPRWAFALHWRGDGTAWRNAALAATRAAPVGANWPMPSASCWA